MKRSYVYLVQQGYTGPIKIGLADNVCKRITELQVGNPIELLLIAVIGPISRKEAEHLERSLHKKFKHKHIRGEWFKHSIDMSAIKEVDISN
jgi:hypothetical protein